MFRRTCVYINVRRAYKQAYRFVSNQLYVRKTSLMSTFIHLKSDKVRWYTGAVSESRTSTIRPNKSQYSLIEGVEDQHRYRPGGYLSLKIGDDLDKGRYRLVDKLGYGGYSTIWLARDLQRAKYVAVKVITANSSTRTPETSLAYSLRNSAPVPGSEILPPLFNDFWVTGPNGKHRCIVTPPARMSLFDAREASTIGLFRPKVARSIIAQLIRGVAFLQSRYYIHLGNILVQFPTTSELYERFGEPQSEAVVHLDGKPLSNSVPARVFIPGWFGVRSDDIVPGEDKIILSDFGESFNPHKTVSSPRRLFLSSSHPRPDSLTIRSPLPRIFGHLPVLSGRFLANGLCLRLFFATPDRVTAEQVETLGVLPPEWWEKWSRRLEWFNEDGTLNLEKTSRAPMACEPRAEVGLEPVTEKERRDFKAMLLSMLAFRPNERATAQHVLHSTWMKDWGQPAVEESWNTLNPELERE
ncbi:Protein kinase domain protein [Aspergillus sclerotialis]|uniref:non-specific serine/threonine protein kinase n=1 Tax=Aspergillus sclerotialis TaxID=2070753 RepID=A0A3A3A281_9EURO|nr:Protein kinase domain protein [Aspergillus sclerotialis]